MEQCCRLRKSMSHSLQHFAAALRGKQENNGEYNLPKNFNHKPKHSAREYYWILKVVPILLCIQGGPFK